MKKAHSFFHSFVINLQITPEVFQIMALFDPACLYLTVWQSSSLKVNYFTTKGKCLGLLINLTRTKGKDFFLAFCSVGIQLRLPYFPSPSSFIEEIVPTIGIKWRPRLPRRPRLVLVAPHGHPFSPPSVLLSAVDSTNGIQIVKYPVWKYRITPWSYFSTTIFLVCRKSPAWSL